MHANGQMKSITLHTLVEKVAEHEKTFRKKSSYSTSDIFCLDYKRDIQPHDSSRG
jgi:hypothetical protein